MISAKSLTQFTDKNGATMLVINVFCFCSALLLSAEGSYISRDVRKTENLHATLPIEKDHLTTYDAQEGGGDEVKENGHIFPKTAVTLTVHGEGLTQAPVPANEGSNQVLETRDASAGVLNRFKNTFKQGADSFNRGKRSLSSILSTKRGSESQRKVKWEGVPDYKDDEERKTKYPKTKFPAELKRKASKGLSSLRSGMKKTFSQRGITLEQGETNPTKRQRTNTEEKESTLEEDEVDSVEMNQDNAKSEQTEQSTERTPSPKGQRLLSPILESPHHAPSPMRMFTSRPPRPPRRLHTQLKSPLKTPSPFSLPSPMLKGSHRAPSPRRMFTLRSSPPPPRQLPTDLTSPVQAPSPFRLPPSKLGRSSEAPTLQTPLPENLSTPQSPPPPPRRSSTGLTPLETPPPFQLPPPMLDRSPETPSPLTPSPGSESSPPSTYGLYTVLPPPLEKPSPYQLPPAMLDRSPQAETLLTPSPEGQSPPRSPPPPPFRLRTMLPSPLEKPSPFQLPPSALKSPHPAPTPSGMFTPHSFSPLPQRLKSKLTSSDETQSLDLKRPRLSFHRTSPQPSLRTII